MRIPVALAAILIAGGCGKSDDSGRRGDTNVAPPVFVESTAIERPDCGVASRPVLTDGGIGELQVGRPVEDVRQKCDVASDAEEPGSEGTKERVLVVKIGEEPVRAVVVGSKVWRIELTTPGIVTSDSLGVDIPLHRLATMRGARFFPGEDGVYGFVADHCSLSFRFSIPLRPPRGSDWTVAAIDQAHGDAAVNKVLVTRCRR